MHIPLRMADAFYKQFKHPEFINNSLKILETQLQMKKLVVRKDWYTKATSLISAQPAQPPVEMRYSHHLLN